MERKIIITEDGSHSVEIPGLQATYHSIHGAIQESRHVFIEAGLHYVLGSSPLRQLSIFEMGFGTGLNVLLTALEAATQNLAIHYTALEKFPLSREESANLNYAELLGQGLLFKKIHETDWEKDVRVSEQLTLRKEKADFIGYSAKRRFDLVYYDAFAPDIQPELWTGEVFQRLFYLLKPKGGVLVTYCSKGEVRRAMIAAGFTVKKLPGPPGKREISRAMKI